MTPGKNTMPASRGIAGAKFSEEERRHPLFKKFVSMLEDERALMREQLESPAPIDVTTLLRGELRHVKRILARTSEVGPGSRQSEGIAPESAPPALAAERFPVSFEQ